MSQPKHRRRAARRAARSCAAPEVYVHVLAVGERRNPVGSLACLGWVCVEAGRGMYDDEEM